MSRAEEFRKQMAEKGFEFTPDQAEEYLAGTIEFIKEVKSSSQSELWGWLDDLKRYQQEEGEPTLCGEPLTDESIERFAELLSYVKEEF